MLGDDGVGKPNAVHLLLHHLFLFYIRGESLSHRSLRAFSGSAILLTHFYISLPYMFWYMWTYIGTYINICMYVCTYIVNRICWEPAHQSEFLHFLTRLTRSIFELEPVQVISTLSESRLFLSAQEIVLYISSKCDSTLSTSLTLTCSISTHTALSAFSYSHPFFSLIHGRIVRKRTKFGRWDFIF